MRVRGASMLTAPNWRAAPKKLPASALAMKALRLASVSMIYRESRKD
jgi:hypothetical protein